MHDFSKPPHVTSPEETAKKKKIASLHFNYCWAFSYCTHRLHGC